MLPKKPAFQMPSKGIYFMSLGGIGEIGANCYLYCCDDKWLMIDLGLFNKGFFSRFSKIIKIIHWNLLGWKFFCQFKILKGKIDTKNK